MCRLAMYVFRDTLSCWEILDENFETSDLVLQHRDI